MATVSLLSLSLFLRLFRKQLKATQIKYIYRSSFISRPTRLDSTPTVVCRTTTENLSWTVSRFQFFFSSSVFRFSFSPFSVFFFRFIFCRWLKIVLSKLFQMEQRRSEESRAHINLHCSRPDQIRSVWNTFESVAPALHLSKVELDRAGKYMHNIYWKTDAYFICSQINYIWYAGLCFISIALGEFPINCFCAALRLTSWLSSTLCGIMADSQYMEMYQRLLHCARICFCTDYGLLLFFLWNWSIVA